MKRYAGVRTIDEGETYEVYFTPCKGVKRVYKTIKAGSQKEAYYKKAELMTAHKADSKEANVERQALPFQIVYKGLIKDVEADNLSKKSIKRYMLTFRKFFLEFLPKKYPEINRVNQLTTPVFNDYKIYYVTELDLVGWRSELIMLKSIINRLVVNGFCKKDIAGEIKPLKKGKHCQKRHNEITVAQKKKLLGFTKADRPSFYGICYCLFKCGWRPNETMCIRKEDIKWYRNRFELLTIKGEYRKTGKDLTLNYLDKNFEEVIRQYYDADNKSEWLFPNKRGNKYNTDKLYRYITKKSPEVIGKKITTYDIKHHFFTDMGRRGASIKDVQRISGVEDVKIIMSYYTHSTKEGVRKVFEMTGI